jgi:hypothetical protein
VPARTSATGLAKRGNWGVSRLQNRKMAALKRLAFARHLRATTRHLNARGIGFFRPPVRPDAGPRTRTDQVVPPGTNRHWY